MVVVMAAVTTATETVKARQLLLRMRHQRMLLLHQRLLVAGAT
jgi:hypothetical protein